ncbi:MAG TPA: tripartite tricarboxylate transporter TctB family protein [Microlunatus sp.]
MSVAVARGNAAFTTVLGLLAVGAVVGGLGYGFTVEEGRIGPGFLPAVCGAVLLLCAVVDGTRQLRERRRPDPALAPDHVAEQGEADSDIDILGRTQKQRNKVLAAVLGLIFAATLLVYVVGFIIAFGLLLFAVAVLVERRKLVPALVISVVVLAAIYAVFAILLQVPFPTGLLGLI